MRTGYTWYKLSADWLNGKSSNNLSIPLSGTLEPGVYKNCKVVSRLEHNKLIVQDLDSNKRIESSLFYLPNDIGTGDSVEIQVALYGDYIITVKGDGSFYACDPVSKYTLNKIAGPSIQWVREWAAERGLREQRPVILKVWKKIVNE
jgi:hypothetical protein